MIVFAFVLLSCDGLQAPAASNNTDSSGIAVENAEISPELVEKFTVNSALPFVQDTFYFDDTSRITGELLSAAEMRYLSFGFVETDIVPDGLRYVTELAGIESILMGDSYDQYYLQSRPGKIVGGLSEAQEKIVMNDSITVLLWSVYCYTTVDDPSTDANVLYASVLLDNTVVSSVALGADCRVTNFPSETKTLALFSMDENAVGTTLVSETNGQYFGAVPGDTTRRKFRLTIENNTWAVVEIVEDEMVFR